MDNDFNDHTQNAFHSTCSPRPVSREEGSRSWLIDSNNISSLTRIEYASRVELSNEDLNSGTIDNTSISTNLISIGFYPDFI